MLMVFFEMRQKVNYFLCLEGANAAFHFPVCLIFHCCLKQRTRVIEIAIYAIGNTLEQETFGTITGDIQNTFCRIGFQQVSDMIAVV